MNRNRVKYLIVPQIVTVRKYEVEIEKLQKLLKEHKNLTNKQIAEQLCCPVTKVEHWFRTDSYFCIPDAEYWLELKKLLNISSDYFDVSILEFEIMERIAFDLKKPFVLLMNMMAINYQEIGNFFQFLNPKIQFIIPDKKVSFDGNTSSFCSGYVCYDFIEHTEFVHLLHNNTKNNFSK